MDTALTLAEMLAASGVSEWPTVTEYVKAAPVDRRAILARWKQLHDHQAQLRASGYRGLCTVYPLTHDEAMAQFEKLKTGKLKLRSAEVIEGYRRHCMSEVEREVDDYYRDDLDAIRDHEIEGRKE